MEQHDFPTISSTEELFIENRALTEELLEVHDRYGQDATFIYTDACRIASEHRAQLREQKLENDRLRNRLAYISSTGIRCGCICSVCIEH